MKLMEKYQYRDGAPIRGKHMRRVTMKVDYGVCQRKGG
jgi:hypothetical protein